MGGSVDDMKIAVCVKQVPAGNTRIDSKNGALLRGESAGIMNPWDLYAIEAALQAATISGCMVTALSMGPASAAAVLRDALSYGVTRGVLLSDSAFAGADVYATSYTLAQGMKALGGFDLVFCGQPSSDGDTAQLPFSLAVQLGAHVAGWVKKVERINDKTITVLQELSAGTQRLTLPYPAVIAVGQGATSVRMPSLKNRLAAMRTDLLTLTINDLSDRNPDSYGFAASPTRVISVCENIVQAKAQAHRFTAETAASLILKEMGECNDG